VAPSCLSCSPPRFPTDYNDPCRTHHALADALNAELTRWPSRCRCPMEEPHHSGAGALQGVRNLGLTSWSRCSTARSKGLRANTRVVVPQPAGHRPTAHLQRSDPIISTPGGARHVTRRAHIREPARLAPAISAAIWGGGGQAITDKKVLIGLASITTTACRAPEQVAALIARPSTHPTRAPDHLDPYCGWAR